MDFSIENLDRLFNYQNVFWRHDVDYDLECAVKMAEFEKERGIRATYYFRGMSCEYSPFSHEYAKTMHRVFELGHRIGVHVDLLMPREYEVATMQVVVAYNQQCAPVSCKANGVFSLHAPPHSALWRDYPGLAHAMSPDWAGLYLADSRGVFRSDPFDFLKNRRGRVQINLHPEWWFLPADEAQAMREREAVKL